MKTRTTFLLFDNECSVCDKQFSNLEITKPSAPNVIKFKCSHCGAMNTNQDMNPTEVPVGFNCRIEGVKK